MTLRRLLSHFAPPLLVMVALHGQARGEDYAIMTYAGTSNVSGSVDGTPGTFNNPYGIAIDADKNLYIADTVNNIIRKITPARVVSTLAGSPGVAGSADGTGSAARFNFPVGLAVDSAGNVYVADSKNFAIRRITPAGVVTTYAGAPFQIGSTDGPAASARFFLPYGLAIDSAGNLYVADGGNHLIRKISAGGVVSTLAGTALQSGYADGSGATARFNTPWGITVDRNGVLFVSDRENHVIRQVSATGVVTTVAGSAGVAGSADGAGASARFNQPQGLSVNASGNIFVADQANSIIRQITSAGVASTIAGSGGLIGDTDSVGAAARFYYTTDVVADGSTIYIVDSSNNLVRKGVPASTAALPVISLQPLDQAVITGQAVTFRVAVSGSSLTYRWFLNGTVIAGATTGSLTIPAAREQDVGVYLVRVSGAGGTIDSAAATLSVLPPGNAPIGVTSRPVSLAVGAGERASFSVTASGTGVTYQWLKDGAAIAGATSSTLVISAAQAADAATYTVRLTAGGVTETLSAKLVVGSSNPANVTITTQPASQTVNSGQAANFSVVATGTGALSYQWFRNDNPITGATSSSYAIAAAQASDAGNYTVRVGSGGVNVLSNTAALTVNVIVTGPTARLSNLSVRTAMSAGQTLIVGVVVSGGSRDVLVRAVGPALAGFGLTTAMADPRLELYNGSTQIFSNDNWPISLASTFAAVGAFGLPNNSLDAAFVQGIDGARSIWALGTGPGVVLVEAYDLGSGNSPRLVNVSARNQVGTGDDILIAGFNIAGTGQKQLLIRAVGPKLGAFGVSGFLADPKLEVYSGATKLAENDNWTASLAPVFSSVSAFALDANSRDAALLTTLPPGSYTVQVRGADGGVGEALIEIYEVLP